MKYQKHIFVCINQREESAIRRCCGQEHGTQIVARFKELIMEHKLKMKVRAQRASCFDICEQGPIAVVYPEGVYYGNVQLADVDEIFKSHILNNQPVERLTLNFNRP